MGVSINIPGITVYLGELMSEAEDPGYDEVADDYNEDEYIMV